jgi:hypothetical protein
MGIALGIESKALPWWIRADENEHQTLVKNGLTNKNIMHACQSALNIDPLSASKIDPLGHGI